MALGVLGNTSLYRTFDCKTGQVVSRLNIPVPYQNTSIPQSHPGELLEFAARVCHTSYRFEEEVSAILSAVLGPQQAPGGMGEPCGQLRGWPRKAQILSVASAERMCSNLQACCSISVSLSMASESVKRRSARR